MSVTKLGPWIYGELTDIYEVAIYNPDFYWVGHPASAPWAAITDGIWVSHNRTFDEALFWQGGFHPTGPEDWHCTADLCAYVGAPRSLKDAVFHLFDIEISKSVRDKMKGKYPEDLSEEDRQALDRYAMDDARYCYDIWQELSDWWPEDERQASRQTSMMCFRGIPVDHKELVRAKRQLVQRLDEIRQGFPWHGQADEKGKLIPLLSPKAFRKFCIEHDVEPPPSMAKTSPAFDEWLTQVPEKVATVARGFGDYRSVNRTLELVKSIEARTDGDRRCHFSLKYFGANTGRWSGDSGLNMQNLTVKDVGGVNIRSCFGFPEGDDGRLVVCDLGQIEARALLWQVGDEKQLSLIRGGMDVYEAHARLTMGYEHPDPMEEVDPQGRKVAKARVLGLGYQCGVDRFFSLCEQWGLGFTHEEASDQVYDFRRANPLITSFWYNMHAMIEAHLGKDLFVKLPSGRYLSYRNIRLEKVRLPTGEVVSEIRAESVLGNRRAIYGGLVVENFIQGMCRDILKEKVLELERRGVEVALHVHDEVASPTTAKEAETVATIIEEVMTSPVSWAPGLPLAAKAKILTHYEK